MQKLRKKMKRMTFRSRVMFSFEVVDHHWDRDTGEMTGTGDVIGSGAVHKDGQMKVRYFG